MTLRCVVVDASVALKWIFAEDDSDVAELLLDLELLAPDFLLIECANAIWSRLKARHIRSAEAHAALNGLLSVPITLTPGPAVAASALIIGEQLEHPVYDCAYLALARIEGVPLVTADRRFAATLRRSPGFAESVLLLADLPSALADSPDP